jgi:hypothetical protein
MRIRKRIRLITLMRIRLDHPGTDPDADSTYHPDADPDADSTYHPDEDPASDFYLTRMRIADPDLTLNPDADPDPSFQSK